MSLLSFCIFKFICYILGGGIRRVKNKSSSFIELKLNFVVRWNRHHRFPIRKEIRKRNRMCCVCVTGWLDARAHVVLSFEWSLSGVWYRSNTLSLSIGTWLNALYQNGSITWQPQAAAHPLRQYLYTDNEIFTQLWSPSILTRANSNFFTAGQPSLFQSLWVSAELSLLF